MLTFKDFKNIHEDKTCIICGTGPSIKGFEQPPCITVGVNKVQRFFDTNYLIVSDLIPPEHPEAPCIINNRSVYTFTNHDQGFRYSTPVRYELLPLHRRNPEFILGRDKLWACMTTTETAIGLALYMGFYKIGIIGWDLTDHGSNKHIKKINIEMISVLRYAWDKGIMIANLSAESAIETIPKMDVNEFLLGKG